MRCFNSKVLWLVLISFSIIAEDSNVSWLEENKRKQSEMLKALKKEGVLAEFDEKLINSKTKKYQQEAQSLAEQASQTTSNFISQYDGLDLKSVSESSELHHSKAIFVSFSLSDAELKSAFIEAGAANADIYLMGLHPKDKNILDTMLRLKKIGSEIKVKPSARFHPKAFKKFNIKSVPTMLLNTVNGAYTASGLLNFDWLESQVEQNNNKHFLGKFGPTKSVVEISLLQEITKRIEKLDVKKLRENAIARFWSHQKFIPLPPATENKIWYIDPTVKVNEDIISPKGHVLARKGDVVNPLRASPTHNTYLVFDATQPKQLEWAKRISTKTSDTTKLMLMTNKYKSDDSWAHLSELREHFNREVYLLPKEMVNRFKLTALPVKVETDEKRFLLKIEQFEMKSL